MFLTEHVHNLREENTKLREAHHDIHTKLQDAQVTIGQIYTTVYTVYCITVYFLCHANLYKLFSYAFISNVLNYSLYKKAEKLWIVLVCALEFRSSIRT